MARKCKSYEELELSDDFMFAKVMQNKALCKELLELIMGFPIADIVYLEEQKTLDAGRHIYSFENRCIQDLNLELGDGTGKIFLSAVGQQNDVSAEMKAFLEYLSKKTIETDFVHRLDREVQRVRDNQKWRKEYMQRQSDWIEDREEAREEGHAEGVAAGKLEMLNQFVKGMKAKNMSETEIKNNLMDIFALPEEEAENLLQAGKEQ